MRLASTLLITANKSEIRLTIFFCSFKEGIGTNVSDISEPEISLNVVPDARCIMSSVHLFKQKYKYSLIPEIYGDTDLNP